MSNVIVFQTAILCISGTDEENMMLFSIFRCLLQILLSFVEIDHEIFSTVILSLPLIQEGQLSVSGERMCTILVNRLED